VKDSKNCCVVTVCLLGNVESVLGRSTVLNFDANDAAHRGKRDPCHTSASRDHANENPSLNSFPHIPA
jgi:hypothetical protein